jgi:hypothetical protein
MLAGSHVRAVVSVNPSKLVLLGDVLESNSARLLREVRGDRALAERLDRSAERRGGRLLLTDLWPRLSLAVCWTAASAGLYLPRLRRLLPGVQVVPFSSTGTEGIVTMPIDAQLSGSPLDVTQGIFEFVECDDPAEAMALAPDCETAGFAELEPGRRYRIVMSQANGLYRYDLGDVYRVTGFEGRVPRLEFVARIGYSSSFTGEKLTEADLRSALGDVLGSGPLELQRCTCVPIWGAPPYYAVALEAANGEVDLRALGRRIDSRLGEINVEFATKRSSGRLGPVSVVRLMPGAFRELAAHRTRSGASLAQMKHHWLQRDDSLIERMAALGLVGEPLAGAPAPAG